MAQTVDEKVKKLEESIGQLKAKKQAILNREKEQQKKQRIKQLISYGEIVEKYYNLENLTPEGFDMNLQDMMKAQEKKRPSNAK